MILPLLLQISTKNQPKEDSEPISSVSSNIHDKSVSVSLSINSLTAVLAIFPII